MDKNQNSRHYLKNGGNIYPKIAKKDRPTHIYTETAKNKPIKAARP